MTQIDLKLLSKVRAAAIQAEANGFEGTAQTMRDIEAQLWADAGSSVSVSKSGLCVSRLRMMDDAIMPLKQ
jgi:hypothetical protein